MLGGARDITGARCGALVADCGELRHHGGMDVIARAHAHAERGEVRAAVELLKPYAAAEQPPYEKRRALAQLYRDLGAPDQAGRWGIVIDGWTTPFERDRLARALVSYNRPSTFLSLPANAPEPADLPAVLGLRAKHSERAAQRYRDDVEISARNPESRAARREEALWTAAAVLLALGAVGPSVTIAMGRILAHDPWAAMAAGAGWSVMALAALLIGLSRLLQGRRPRIGPFSWAVVAMACLAITCFVLAAHWGAG